MANYDFAQNYGKVKRLYPTNGGIFFWLKDGQTSMISEPGYYFLPSTHDNYKELADLLYWVALLGWQIKVRTKDVIVSGHAEVVYFVVDI